MTFPKYGKLEESNGDELEGPIEDTVDTNKIRKGGSGTTTLESYLSDQVGMVKNGIYLRELSVGGNGKNKFLSSQLGPTNLYPLHFGFDVSCVGIVYRTTVSNSDINIQFFLNGLVDPTNVLYTETGIRNYQNFHRASNTSIFDVDIGDDLSVFSDEYTGGTGVDPGAIELDLFFKIRNNNVGVGGS
jgi:hypothetical protein